MKALSLKQPWAWSIVHGPKRIENRKWAPWPQVVGEVIAIHASKTYDEDGASYIRQVFREPPAKGVAVAGAIIGVARVVGCARSMADPRLLPLDQVYWFFGPYAWLLDDVRALASPVPCAGALALWNVPSALETQVLQLLGGSR